MEKELKEKLIETLADVFHEAWMKWATAVKPEVKPERSARWDEYMVPYDQLEEGVKDLDREWAIEALDAIEADLGPAGGPVKEMVTKVQVDSSKYPQLSKVLAVEDPDTTYEIVRHYKDGHPRKTLETGLTLKEAQEHCKDPETSSKTCESPKNVKHTEKFGEWFDGYEKE